MLIQINENNYQLPASLLEITLGERIEFDNTYGKELKQKLQEAIALPDGVDKDFAFAEYQCDLACKTLSFFGGVPLDIIQNTQLEQVLLIYHELMKSLTEDFDFTDTEFKLQSDFQWKEELWEIAPPELTHTSTITFTEFLDAKQAVKNLVEYGDDHWEALLMLCCIYFRKKDEKYKSTLAEENGERYQLLKSLPLEYAMHVGFFLSGSTSSYIQTFLSFNQQENPQLQN